MTRSTTSSVFPDVNVWIALTLKAHEHHSVAWNWYHSLAPHQTLVFCRFTQLGFLRLLTTEAVAKHETLTQKGAWAAYDLWIDKGGATYMNEPLGLDIEFRDLSDQLISSPKAWTDSYLAAFARAASLNLVTFDKALSKKASQPVLLNAYT
jgi:toxin-antitoxin system PIN domain toxin